MAGMTRGHGGSPGLLLTGRTDVLPPSLVNYWSHEIGCYNDRIDLKLDKHLGSAAADVLAKLQNDWKSLNLNLAASSLHEILRQDIRPLSE